MIRTVAPPPPQIRGRGSSALPPPLNVSRYYYPEMGQSSSRREILEDIEAGISRVDEVRLKSERLERKVIILLIVLAILLVCIYVYIDPRVKVGESDLPWWVVPVIICIIFVALVSLLKYCCRWHRSRYDKELKGLLHRKRDVIQEVKEKEYYNTAKQLLQQFDTQIHRSSLSYQES